MANHKGKPCAEHHTSKSRLANSEVRPLNIAIVGAGIGGLCAAIALRRVGHSVVLYEQSSLAREVGAAIHLAPNANGILRRWGVFAEDFGANLASRIKEIQYSGHVIKDIDLAHANTMWQHPWQLVHRAALHARLKAMATDTRGIGTGPPAEIHTSSKVVDVGAEDGILVLNDGKVVKADIVVGADGVYSRCREAIIPNSPKPYSSGKAAFRFLLPTQSIKDDPETAHIETKEALCIWFGDDRRIVAYPCNENQTLNFVCIHPDSESHATASDEWNKSASLEQILHVYKDFDPALLKLFRKVKPEELKVWQLLDMEKMPSWTRGKLALMGDAAHPFTPYQGQGAGQAIEDSAALATVLPLGTVPEEVPERLKLYESIRADRAHKIQEFSRQAGKDWINGKPQIDMMAYTSYNFGHDEYDHAGNIFRRWLWAREKHTSWRMPMPLWPAPTSELEAVPIGGFTTAEITFKTSRTYLETLFPNAAYRFRSPATVCQASFSATTLHNVPLLGGRTISRLGLYIQGVQHVGRDGIATTGSYLPFLLEDLVASVIPGRVNIGVPRLCCDLDMSLESQRYQLKGSWDGTTFVEINLGDLTEGTANGQERVSNGTDDGILAHHYSPVAGQPGVSDAEYPVLIPHDRDSGVDRILRTRNASVKFDAGEWESLPTLHHIATVLAEVPIFSVVSARVTKGSGEPWMSSCRRLQ